jgi:hypothetical protein
MRRLPVSLSVLACAILLTAAGYVLGDLSIDAVERLLDARSEAAIAGIVR